MNLSALLQGFGSSGPFASRIFLPALLTALLLRFGPDIPLIHHLGLLSLVPHNQPTWFTSDISLIVLTGLSILEVVAQKNVEARRILTEFDIYLKPAMAALTCFGYLSSTDSSFIRSTIHQAGFGSAIWPVSSAFLTWRLSIIRKQVTTAVFDHLDGTHLDHLISWLEDAWAMFGTLLLVLFPVLMLVTVGLISGALMLLRQQLKAREEHARIACAGCSKPIYPSALACPSCRKSNPAPAEIGFLGQSKPYPATDLTNQPYRLVEKRRCPVCAAHRPPRQIAAPCQDCSSTDAADPAFTAAYTDYIGARVPVVLTVCFLMSLVPIVGLIVSSVYSRMELVLPFSQYLPLGKNFMLRWGIRILFLILVFLQLIPVLGGFVGPVMAYISYTAYRNSYRSYASSLVRNDNASAAVV
jgi:hypothetical protein